MVSDAAPLITALHSASTPAGMIRDGVQLSRVAAHGFQQPDG
jgi:hypothetical protein